MRGFWLKILFLLTPKLIPKKIIAKQARKPSGLLGRYVLQPMFIAGNRALNQSLFALIQANESQTLLEIGCGPGELLSQICHADKSCQVHAVDFSETMLAQAEKRNAAFVEAGQLQLLLTDCEVMPFEDNYFDQVVTANTLYFWQPPEIYLREVLRVIKPGGKLLLGFRTADQINAMNLDETIFARYSESDAKQLALDCGFLEASTLCIPAQPVDSYILIARK